MSWVLVLAALAVGWAGRRPVAALLLDVRRAVRRTRHDPTRPRRTSPADREREGWIPDPPGAWVVIPLDRRPTIFPARGGLPATTGHLEQSTGWPAREAPATSHPDATTTRSAA